MPNKKISRRKLIEGALLASAGAFSLKASADQSASYTKISDVAPREEDFTYEIQRSDEEWQALLSPEEYLILREGNTEAPKSSPLWNEKQPGDYRCKGCGLLAYSSTYKIILQKGWVFFTRSEPDSTLNGVDLQAEYGDTTLHELTEAHCRRCGSHLGHIVYLNKRILHCINGASLTFEANPSNAEPSFSSKSSTAASYGSGM